MNRTVLITGAGGNIGTKLRAHFTDLGWSLRLLDVDARGDAAIQVADLAEWDDTWMARFAGVDTVIHLAGDPSPQASWAAAQRQNIDLTANVYAAAVAQGVRRVVFASSNWVMAGHRPGQCALTTEVAPYPINPYGVSKLVGERIGRSAHLRHGVSVICFRIGYLQRGDNKPGAHMGWGGWGQAMWLSNRDLCHAMERAVLVEGVGFAVLNLMSDNPGMRWDIETTKRTIGYLPKDGAVPVLTRQSSAMSVPRTTCGAWSSGSTRHCRSGAGSCHGRAPKRIGSVFHSEDGVVGTCAPPTEILATCQARRFGSEIRSARQHRSEHSG
jgi:NAD+ dependent glucose-6-phosphate dehydrogenase